MRTIPAERNSLKVKALRNIYATKMIEDAVPDEQMVFVDESPFNLKICRTMGWSPLGERSVSEISLPRGQNISLLLAVSLGGVEYFEMIHESTVNSAGFSIFCERLQAHLSLPIT